jgi:prepilin-type processing-associated H-X9-DG protein
VVAGQPDVTRCTEVLDVADAFHLAVAGLPRPAFLDRRDDPWTYGDRVAWAELPVDPHGVMAGLLRRLAAARRPVALPAQPVHGDLLGNVLFADGRPPAVIDWPVYFRPALWARAVAVTDALVWAGAPARLVDLGGDRPGWWQMLLRALIYRIATNEGLCRAGRPVQERAADYRPAVDLVLDRSRSHR